MQSNPEKFQLIYSYIQKIETKTIMTCSHKEEKKTHIESSLFISIQNTLPHAILFPVFMPSFPYHTVYQQ